MARQDSWIKNGCNAFEAKNPTSQPLSFWTEQDILHYIKKYNVPYCSVYGDIVIDVNSEIEGQINLIDVIGDYEETDRLKTTGCDRTGCIFCMFGCHLEKGENRFQRLKRTHPRQYDFCINGGEYNEEGKWQPNKEGLGLAKVLDYIGVDYE
jgi:3'-phosphoadenosine 5'-phosphosulfate sulfotransferase (PAPS reductase)/FAD synthetase